MEDFTEVNYINDNINEIKKVIEKIKRRVSTRQGSLTVTKLEEAIHWLKDRREEINPDNKE